MKTSSKAFLLSGLAFFGAVLAKQVSNSKVSLPTPASAAVHNLSCAEPLLPGVMPLPGISSGRNTSAISVMIDDPVNRPLSSTCVSYEVQGPAAVVGSFSSTASSLFSTQAAAKPYQPVGGRDTYTLLWRRVFSSTFMM